MSLDPNNLTPNKINLAGRISQPLRSVMSTGKRMMSNGKFIKSMRSALASNKSDGITDKVAKKMALRLAVGVKDLGVTAKKEKGFFGKMKERGMLSSMYKYSVKNAITHYKTMAGAATAANDDIEKEMTPEQIETGRQEHKDQHHRMQKIRDDIEHQKEEKQGHEVSASQNYGEIDTVNAVTSVNQLVHRPGQTSSSGPSLPMAGSPFSGSIDEPENKLSAGDLVQNAPPTQLD